MIVNKAIVNQMIANQKTTHSGSAKIPVLEGQCEVPSCVFWFALTGEDPGDFPDLPKNSQSPHAKKHERVRTQLLTFLGWGDQQQSERKEEKKKPPCGFSSSNYNRRRHQVSLFRKGRVGDHLPKVRRFHGTVGQSFSKTLKKGIQTCLDPPPDLANKSDALDYCAIEKGIKQQRSRRSRNFTGKEGILDAHFKNCYHKKCETS